MNVHNVQMVEVNLHIGITYVTSKKRIERYNDIQNASYSFLAQRSPMVRRHSSI